jgi:hypothetical protein
MNEIHIYTAKDCRFAFENHLRETAIGKVALYTDLAMTEAVKGKSNLRIEEKPDGELWERIKSLLKEVGYEIIETGMNYFVFSWEME